MAGRRGLNCSPAQKVQMVPVFPEYKQICEIKQIVDPHCDNNNENVKYEQGKQHQVFYIRTCNFRQLRIFCTIKLHDPIATKRLSV